MTLEYTCQTTAHPRSRGEHWGFESPWAYRHGSSPLTRGALVGRRGGELQRRLIPAHAGSTSP